VISLVQPTPDDLLGRYLAGREPAALEAVVRRYGGMVLGVCRRVLGDPHDAQDAFQATFLVLVRKAASIRRRDDAAGAETRVGTGVTVGRVKLTGRPDRHNG
jgi:hypothetical protein